MFKNPFKKKVEEEPNLILISQQTHTRLKKGWDEARMSSGNKTIELQETYYTTKGNIYYTHTNILDMNVERQLYLGKSLKGIEFGVTDKVRDRFLDRLDKAVDKGDVDKIKLILKDFRLRLEKLPQERLLLEVALTMFYRHDESPYSYNHLLQMEKLQEAEEDANLRAFFILGVWEVVKESIGAEKLDAYKIQSGQDFLNYLLMETLKK